MHIHAFLALTYLSLWCNYNRAKHCRIYPEIHLWRGRNER